MHKYLFCGILFSLFFSHASAQWAQEYKAGYTTNFQQVISTSDGHLVAVGDFTQSSTSPNLITITKTTLAGKIVWAKSFGKDVQQNGLYIAETKDGGYVVSGIEIRIDPGSFEPSSTLSVFKLTAAGTLVWSKLLQQGNQNNMVSNALIATADGGVLLGGAFTQSIGPAILWNSYLAKLDNGGNVSWSRQLDAPGPRRWITALVETNAGYTVVSQSFTGNILAQADAVNVSKINKSGTVLNSVQVTLQAAPVHFVQSACATGDNGIAIAAAVGNGPGSFDLWLLKINNQMKVSWSSTIDINADDRPNRITRLSNGNLLVTGTVLDKTITGKPLMLEIKPNGRLLRSRAINETARGAFGVALRSDTAYVVINDQFGIGSRYATLYSILNKNAICNTDGLAATQYRANGLLITNRSVEDQPATPVTSVMPYTLENVSYAVSTVCSVLPLQLLTFTAQASGSSTVLRWSAAAQVNTSHFAIERYTGSNYEAIGTVKTAAGTTAGNYAFTDKHPLPGTNLYRLKIVDADGTFTYSYVVSIQHAQAAIATVLPNPASTYTFLKLRLPQAEKIEYTVVNAMGIRLLTKSLPAPVQVLDEKLQIAHFAPGLYYIKIKAGMQSYTLQLVKD